MRKAGMTMKQIGKQLRQCAYIMQEELLHHAIFVFPLVVLVVLAHLVQAFTYHGALLPFHVVYYQQFLFWKLDILVGVLLLSYLLFSQLWRQKQHRLFRYELLPAPSYVSVIGRLFAIVFLLLSYCFIIDLLYLAMYQIMAGQLTQTMTSAGVFRSILHAYYLHTILPITWEQFLLLFLLCVIFAFFSVTIAKAWKHPLSHGIYFLILFAVIFLLFGWYRFSHLSTSIIDFLQTHPSLQEPIEQVLQFMQIPYLLDGVLLIAGSVAIFNYWLIQHRLQKRREKGL